LIFFIPPNWNGNQNRRKTETGPKTWFIQVPVPERN
jgi:hypothetical protein